MLQSVFLPAYRHIYIDTYNIYIYIHTHIATLFYISKRRSVPMGFWLYEKNPESTMMQPHCCCELINLRNAKPELIEVALNAGQSQMVERGIQGCCRRTI